MIDVFHRMGLVQIDGIMNVNKYIDILNENLEKAVLKMSLDKGFQQDNDLNRIAKKFFNDSNIKLLE